MPFAASLASNRILRALFRHLLPIFSTTTLLVAYGVLLTLPIAAVFVIDNDPSFGSEYLKFVFILVSCAVGLSLGLLFPFAWLIECLIEQRKLVVLAGPPLLLLVTFGVSFWTENEWAGGLCGFLVLFCFYWAVLWIGRGVVYGLRKFHETASAYL
jgi:hypothetical protein